MQRNTRAVADGGCERADAGRAGAGRHSEARRRKVHARQWARSDPLGRPSRAARRRRRLVPRRSRARGARPHGFRAPVRTHDVPGLEAHRERCALQAARRRRRDGRQRHDRISIAPTTSRRCRRTSWSWRSGSSPIAWDTCSRRWTRRSCRTSRTSSGTSGVRATRTGRTASSKRRCSRRCFRKGHPYHGNVIGSHADIQAAKLDDVREFFRQYYAPNNATIAIAGDIDKAATKKLIEKYFGSLKRGPAVPPVNVHDARHHVRAPARRRRSRRAAAGLHGVDHARRFSKKATPTPTSRASILGQGRVEPSVQEARVRKADRAERVRRISTRRCSDRSSRSRRRHGPAVRCRSSRPPSTKSSKRLRAKGPTAAEVDRARNVLETQIFNGLQLVGGFGGVADQLNLYNHYVGTPDYLAQDVAAAAG